MTPVFWAMVSAWLAFLLWAAGELMLAANGPEAARGRREVWTAGAAALILHLLLAFGMVHQWSHAAAVTATARQTQALTGIEWGGGVYINYLLVAWWLADAVFSWARPQWWNLAGPVRMFRRGFFWFMWFNGAVVFASGWRRAPAALVCCLVLAAWWTEARRVR